MIAPLLEELLAGAILSGPGWILAGSRLARRRIAAGEFRADIGAVAPESLLGRPVRLADVRSGGRWIRDAVVAVTGAGGSIGSELCRQVAALGPRRLLLIGHGENSLFRIHESLVADGVPTERLRVVLADVADSARIRALFGSQRPRVVFHAAAHKHVPICEANVCEAIRNNVAGTQTLAMAAAAAGVAKFVMVSSDKAVNPTNVMGATKRIAEMLCRSFERHSSTQFVSVRFGNVLGSRGSVVPLFARQVERGGPVTITHREMTRYFMTIPEAVSLILAAAGSSDGGNLFVLDMGEPLRILHLAERVIAAMGRRPYRDVAIREIGLRPGEKLFEELFADDETACPTSVERVHLASQRPMDYGAFASSLERLISGARRDDVAAVVAELRDLVPSYEPGEHLLAAPTLRTAVAIA